MWLPFKIMQSWLIKKVCVAATRTEELELITVSSRAVANTALKGKDLPFFDSKINHNHAFLNIKYWFLFAFNKINYLSQKNKTARGYCSSVKISHFTCKLGVSKNTPNDITFFSICKEKYHWASWRPVNMRHLKCIFNARHRKKKKDGEGNL